MKAYALILLLTTGLLTNCKKADNDQASPQKDVREITSEYTLSKNEEWSGTIHLKASVVVPSGVTLTMKPGTKVIVSNLLAYIDVTGSLIMNGTSSEIIRFYSDNSNANPESWRGIDFRGSQLVMSYCSISNAAHAIALWTYSPTTLVTIDHCLFSGNYMAINDLSDASPIKISYVTFLNSSLQAYRQGGEGKIVSFTNCVFDGNQTAFLLSRHPSVVSPAPMTISVSKSNFTSAKSGKFAMEDVYYPLRTTLSVSESFGMPDAPVRFTYSSNFVSVQNSVSTPIAGIGCGFN